MSYPKTGEEVYVSLNLSNTMLTGIGKGTITREEVSADYLKRLFARYGVIVSAKPEQRRLLELVNDNFDLGLEIPETLKLEQLQRLGAGDPRDAEAVPAVRAAPPPGGHQCSGPAPEERLPAAGIHRGGVQRGHLHFREILHPGPSL